MSQQYYFYPAANFPGQSEKVKYDIGGTLVPDNIDSSASQTTIPPRPNANDSVPEVKPAQAPPSIPITVPIATPSSSSSSKNDVSVTKSSSESTMKDTGHDGINSITSQQAIEADSARKENHPSIPAVTTSTPAQTLPAVQNAAMSMTAPPITSNTQSTMGTEKPPSTVPVMDSATDPNNLKTSL